MTTPPWASRPAVRPDSGLPSTSTRTWRGKIPGRGEHEVHVGRLEADLDRCTRGGRRRRAPVLAAHTPAAPERELVEIRHRNAGVAVHAGHELGEEPLSAYWVEVCLRGREARRGHDRLRGHRRGKTGHAGLAQKRPKGSLALGVVALAELGVADLTVRVDQILRGPVLIAPGVPGAVAVVLHDGVAQAVGRDRLGDVPGVLLERELRRLDADDVEAIAMVGRVEALEERQRPDAVDARVRPEIDEHDAAMEAMDGERPAAGRVEPSLGVGERRRRPEAREVARGTRARELRTAGATRRGATGRRASSRARGSG